MAVAAVVVGRGMGVAVAVVVVEGMEVAVAPGSCSPSRLPSCWKSQTLTPSYSRNPDSEFE